SPQDSYHYEVYSHNLARHVFDELIAPHVELEDTGPYFESSFVGCQDRLDRASSDHSYVQAHWQIQALLQHYGRRSYWLDMTFDSRVALFFACYDADVGEPLTDGTGYVYFLPLGRVAEHWWPLIDLRGTAETVAQIARMTAERPRAQAAAALRLSGSRLHRAYSDTEFGCIPVRRSAAVS